MRKIRTQADADKRMKRNNLIVGIILVGLLVISTAGYSLMSSDEDDGGSVSEFGVDFSRSNSMWVADIGGGVFWFQNLPSEVLDIDVNISISFDDYANQPLYFVNPNEGASEILSNLGNYVLRYQEACLVNSSCDGNLPSKGCDNNLIIFESGNDSMVYQNESCIFIVGDAVRATDAFLYNVLGVN